jgi:hypothetical protein
MFQILNILSSDYTICGSEVHIIQILVKIESLGLVLVTTIFDTCFLVFSDPLLKEVGLTL